MIDIGKLRVFPDRIGLYAPGDYMCHCRECGSEFIGDKRSIECFPCAERESLRARLAASEARVAELEGKVIALCIENEQALQLVEAVQRGNAEYSHRVADLEAAQPITAAERAVGWRPIETAPNDGTRVIMGFLPDESGYTMPPCEGFFNRKLVVPEWVWMAAPNSPLYPQQPTHWMPLPDPPALKKARGEA